MKYLAVVFLVGVIIHPTIAQDQVGIPDIGGDLMLDIGFTSWSASSDSVDQGVWPSKSASLYYIKRKALSNKLSFIYGIGFSMDKIDFGNTHTMFSGGDSTYVGRLPLDLDITNVSKNRLATTYFEIPLEIRFHPSGTEEGEGLFIGAGGLLGVLMNAHTKWKYDVGGESVVQKLSGRFDLAGLRYGAQFRLGYKGVHLFYKRYFNQVFRDPVTTQGNGSLFNPIQTTIGINLTGF